LRRKLLVAALSGASAVFWRSRTLAQRKMSQAEEEYQNHPKNGLVRAACSLFRPP